MRYHQPRPHPLYLIRRSVLVLIGGLAVALLAGCQEEEGIKSYTVPKPPKPADKRPVTFDVPEGWRSAPLAPMSIATFRIGEEDVPADVTITPLRGEGGGLLRNVNRWREQIGLAPIDDLQMRKELREVQVDGTPGQAVDLVGPEGPSQQRIVAVIVPRGGMTWFFRMKGPAEVVAKQKAAFDRFVASVRFAGDRGGN